MGSKSSSTPAPDPRLVEAQIESLGIQNDAISQMMSISSGLAPLQQQQLQQSIDQAKQLWNWSQQDRDYSLERRNVLTGLQDQMVQDASNFNTEARREELAGQARGDVAQSFSSMREANARAMQRQGVNPGDGRSLAMGNQMTMAEAATTANAANQARTAARQEGQALTDRAANAMAGYPALSTNTVNTGNSTMGAGTAAFSNSINSMLSPYSTISSAAGNMGSNATSMYSTQANAYQNAQSSNNSLYGGLGSALGGLAGIGIQTFFGK